MSSKNPLSKHCKESAERKYRILDKENKYALIQTGKFSEGKNDGGKKKGLSLNGENRAVRMPTRSSSVGKSKFPIYVDGIGENGRSRSRAREDVCRKDIRARQDSKELETVIVSTTKGAKINSPHSRAVSRR